MYLDDIIILNKNEITDDDVMDFLWKLKLPFPPRDYQLDAFKNSIRKKRSTLQMPTGSGKSINIFLFAKYALSKIKGKCLLIVPNISLVKQMYSDFMDYGCDEEIHCISGGVDKNSDKI
jgi:superfamily II DNA or RNA helicase